MVQAICGSWRRGGGLADKVARFAKRIWIERRRHHTAELGAQPSECTIDVPVVLPGKVLQEFLPRPRRTADERLHLLYDLVLRHRRDAGRRRTQFEGC